MTNVSFEALRRNMERRRQGLLSAVGSTGERNTLIFRERWGVSYEVSSACIFYGQTEVRDMG